MEGFFRNKFYLGRLLESISAKLLFLQETWTSYSQENEMKKYFPDFNLQISSSDMFTAPEDLLCNTDHTWHGTAIMWHISLDSSVSRLTTTNSRFTAVTIKIQDHGFLVMSVYFPTCGKDEEYLELCTDLVNFVTLNQQMNSSDIVLVGADSNCSNKS